MTQAIKHRETGETLCYLPPFRDENGNLNYRIFRDQALKGADFRGLNLRGVVFQGCHLERADFTGANLELVLLSQAVLTGAIGLPEAPVVPNLELEIWEALQNAGTLNMERWHGTVVNPSCGTIHCRAGWAIHLAGPAGYALEETYGSECAGALIYHASCGYVPDFHASTYDAYQDIREKAYA